MKPEILSGIHPVYEAIRAARREILEVFLESGKNGGRLGRIEQRALRAGIPVKRLPTEKITALVESRRHQGAAARVGPLPLYALPAVIAADNKARDPFLLLLDQVLDPHNLGAIVRTALCAGVDGILCPRDRAAGPSPTVSRISAGALEHVRMTVVTNLAAAIKTLKEEHFWVAGMDVAGDQSLFSADLSGPLAVVIGGEEKGLRPLVKKQCDYLVSIPQANALNSLNASVAGAVVMYEVFRQRGLKKES